MKTRNVEKEKKELAEELGISEEKVAELLEDNTADGIRKMFSALEENLDKLEPPHSTPTIPPNTQPP